MLLRIMRSERLKTLFTSLALLGVAAGLLHWPTETMAAAKEGLALCANVIVPSLFPFFVLASLVVELGLARRMGRWLAPVMEPLFHVGGPCAAAVVLGAVGGYPVGARTAISLYREKLCSKAEAQRLLAFCNNSGPAFILGVVGAGIFESSLVGLLLYLCHIAASLVVGVLFRFYGPVEPFAAAFAPEGDGGKSVSAAFTSAVTRAMTSALNIAAFVLFFTVFTRILSLFHLFDWANALLSPLAAPLLERLGLPEGSLNALLTGLMELTGGVTALSGGPVAARASLAAFMLGWAGISIHFQVLSFLADSGLSPRSYFLGKFLHGVISAIFTYILARFLPLEAPVSALLGEQVLFLSDLNFARTLAFSLLLCCGIFLFFALWGGKKEEAVLK